MVRPPKGQNNYEEWEKKVILAVNGQGVTSEQLTHVLLRSANSITNKAAAMGVSLKGKVKK